MCIVLPHMTLYVLSVYIIYTTQIYITLYYMYHIMRNYTTITLCYIITVRIYNTYYCIILHHITSYRSISYSVVLHYITLYYIQHYVILYCAMLYYTYIIFYFNTY